MKLEDLKDPRDRTHAQRDEERRVLRVDRGRKKRIRFKGEEIGLVENFDSRSEREFQRGEVDEE